MLPKGACFLDKGKLIARVAQIRVSRWLSASAKFQNDQPFLDKVDNQDRNRLEAEGAERLLKASVLHGMHIRCHIRVHVQDPMTASNT